MIMTFRERLKKWLTQGRAYEWYSKYIWNPDADSIQGTIKAYAEENHNVFFVQVGANDGFKNDPLYCFVRSYNWNGILVEPQSKVYEEKLKPTYKKETGLHFANVAIGPESEERTLYRIAFSSARWATGLASFEKENIEKHIKNGYVAKWAGREKVALPENREDYITGETVETITFDDLLNKFNVNAVDAIFIDAEGFDYQILQSVDLEKYQPDLLLFEELHIPDEQRKKLNEKFSRLGYSLKKEKRDVLAYRPEARGFQ